MNQSPAKPRLDAWMKVYQANLEKAVIEHPDEYCWPASQVPVVAAKMRGSFEQGTFNKDGRAIKDTCKHFGVKHTYTAINNFLSAAA